MKNLGIYVNKNKDRTLEFTEKLLSIADKYGFKCSILADSRNENNEDEFVKKCDAVVVLGGDGTILRIASAAAKNGVPLLSANLGHLGFLTELEADELESGIKKLALNDFTVEKRMMLLLKADNEEHYALNDICLQRTSRARLLKFKAYASGEFVDSLSADGVLVSSPTGSTAYSLSAGGPIISPKLSLLLMTPVCAHTLRARPIVFSDDECLSFVTDDECGFALLCDGVHIKSLDGVKNAEIRKSENPLLLINFKKKNFYRRLNSKFNEWNFSGEENR